MVKRSGLSQLQPLLISLCHSTTMGLDDKINAAAKDREGRVQAAAGELTGDERMKLEGDAKQLQAKVIDAAGDLKDKAQDVTDCVRPVFANLLDEIKLSFGYHENQSGRGIDEIYVSGGSADMAGLDDLFQDALGSKPRRWDPFQFLRAPDIDTTALGSLKNSFGVAIGLALR